MTVKYLLAKEAGSTPGASVSGICPAPSCAASPTPGSNAPLPKLLKIGQAAKFLGCSPITVRRRVNDGSLPHYRIRGRLLFDQRDLHLYLERHKFNDEK